MAFVSNNVKERVETFAREFHAPCYPFAKKPLKRTYRKDDERDCGYAPHQIAVLGDQLLTDMLGANRMHFYSILTKPVAEPRSEMHEGQPRVRTDDRFRVLGKPGKDRKGGTMMTKYCKGCGARLQSARSR